MIIGLDDSGNFTTDPLSFYAAVFIRPKKADKIFTKFLEWETQLPASAKENGEVKGRLLNKEQLLAFTENILIQNGFGAVKLEVFGIEINAANNTSLETQRKRNVEQLKRSAKEVYRDQGKEFTQIATFYEQMADWLQAKSTKTLYKIELLNIAIVKSINFAILTSVYRGFDRELGQLEINIDHGITGRESVDRFWRDSMRTSFWHVTSSLEPIIHLTTWGPNHPYVKRFIRYPKSKESLGIWKKAMRNVSQFYDSKDKPEIRIADIVANTFYRKYVKNEPIAAVIQKMQTQRVIRRGTYTMIKMSGQQNPNPINPYTDKVEGISADELKEKYGDDDEA